MLTAKPLRELFEAFASSDPTPGGGSAAAVASALGASLLLMVTRLPKTRSGTDEDRSSLAAAAAALTGIQRQLTEAIDADADAYARVVAAYRLPGTSDADRTVRTAAVQRARQEATDVPLHVMRLSVDALTHAPSVAAHGHRPATSDVGVALALLQAGFEGARLNVFANLGGIADHVYSKAVTAESERLSERLQGLIRDARAPQG